MISWRVSLSCLLDVEVATSLKMWWTTLPIGSYSPPLSPLPWSSWSSLALSLGLLLTTILSWFYIVKIVNKVSPFEGNEHNMVEFCSNNLIPHVHVLYLNVGTKWMKNNLGGPTWHVGRPPSMANWPFEYTIMMGLAYGSYLQKICLFGQNWSVSRPMKFGQMSSKLVRSKPRGPIPEDRAHMPE